MTKDNKISHPSHYCDGRKYEPKDVIRDWNLNFNLGSAVKYISRAGRKGDILEDLYKARQFLEFEIQALGGKTSGIDIEDIKDAVSDLVKNDHDAVAMLGWLRIRSERRNDG